MVRQCLSTWLKEKDIMARHKSTETHAFIRRPCESGGCLDLEFGHRSQRPLIATWILETALMFGLYKKQSRN